MRSITQGQLLFKVLQGVLKVTLVDAFGFLPQILGGGRNVQMVLSHSMDAGSP